MVAGWMRAAGLAPRRASRAVSDGQSVRGPAGFFLWRFSQGQGGRIMTVPPPNSPVVIYVNGSPYGHDGTEPVGHPSGPLSGSFPHVQHAELLSCGRPYDAYKVHREFPERWQAYIRASYRNIGHVCQVFHVSERTARKWWAGETGAVGGHVAIAINEHPQDAPRMLFAAE